MKKLLWVIVFLFFLPLFSFAGFTDNGDGTITDHNTGLTWMQATGDTDNDGDLDENDRVTWQAALSYCESLDFGGYSDWRLPTDKELQSIVDYDYYTPAVNTSYFLDTMSSNYWSSTTDVNYADNAWLVSFGLGGVYGGPKSSAYYVRAVRGGQ